MSLEGGSIINSLNAMITSSVQSVSSDQLNVDELLKYTFQVGYLWM